VNLYYMAGLLAVFVLLTLGPLSLWLSRSSWVTRAPRAAVGLWQAIGASAMIAGIGAGLCLAAERYHRGFVSGIAALDEGVTDGHPLSGLGVPDALGLTLAADLGIVLLSLLLFVTVRTAMARARHRQLLTLLSTKRSAPSGTVMLDHPSAVAYCLPGLRPRIVISAGTVHLLDRHELAAVIEHERGHANEHHGLVMLPLAGFSDLFRWVPYARLAPQAVAGLLEMAADDYAAREHSPNALVSALVAMSTAGPTPTCAFSLSTVGVPDRVERLLSAHRASKQTAMVGGMIATAVIAAPLALMAIW
jgi:Zn-dependent protease with chaperone function